MNQKTSDHEWQQLQAHIEGFVGQVLRNDVQRVEYRPLFIGRLLKSERQQDELQGTITISGNVNQKGGAI